MSVEKGQEFEVWIDAPGVAKAACRTGEFMDAVFHRATDAEAVVAAFAYTASCAAGKLATKAAFGAAVFA